MSENSTNSNSKKREPSWILHLIMGISIPLFMIFLPWMSIDDEEYTIIRFFKHVSESGGISKYANQSAGDTGFMIVNYYALWLFLIVGTAMLVRGIALACGRDMTTVGGLSYFFIFLYVPVFTYLGVMTPGLGFGFTLLAFLIDMAAGVYMDQRKRIQADAKARKEKDANAKAEKKRRMSFEGEYGREFGMIIFKNFKANIKNYVLFYLSGAAAMTLVLVVLGMQDSLGGADLAGNYYQRTVLKTVNQILPIVAALSILIITMTITYYIRSKIENYSLCELLGIRRSTLRLIIVSEFMICVVLAFITGLIAGELIIKHYTGSFTAIDITGVSLAAFLLIIGLSTLINVHIFQYTDIMRMSFPDFSEAIPGNFAKYIVPAGIIVMIIPIARFANMSNYEAFSMILMELAGSAIVIYFAGSIIVNRRIKAAKKDELKLPDILDWRYRFRTNIRFVIIVFILHFVAFSVCLPNYASNSIGAGADELAPYDRILLAYDDDTEDVSNLLDSEDVSVSKYEILRATTPLGDAVSIFQRNYEQVLWPQGQHIIISQSEYERLCEERGIEPETLDLAKAPDDDSRIDLGEKSEHVVHVVLQQDAAMSGHKLEWYAGSHNRFKVGMPVESYAYFEREVIFKDHEATYGRQLLIGSLRGGVQENLIVVNDDYFDRVYSLEAESADTSDEASDDAEAAEYTEDEDDTVSVWRSNSLGSADDYEGDSISSDEIVFDDVKEGPTYMYLINYGDDADSESLDEGLQAIADKHEDDRRLNTTVEGFYNAEENAEWTLSLRDSNSSLNLGILIALLFTSVVMMGIKYMLGMDEKKRQFKMLETLGMREKDRKKLYNRETRMLIWGSYIMAIIVSLPFILGIISTRMMTGTEITMYLGMVGKVVGLYTIVYGVTSIIVRNALRRV